MNSEFIAPSSAIGVPEVANLNPRIIVRLLYMIFQHLFCFSINHGLKPAANKIGALWGQTIYLRFMEVIIIYQTFKEHF